MPLHDYRHCGVLLEDQYRSVREGARSRLPACPLCGEPMAWIPQAGFDLKGDGDGDKGFQKFGVWRQVMTKDGPVQIRETVDSLHKMRAIEKDSEQRFRNGEGEPLRFRGLSQNRSNMDTGLFGAAGQIGEQAYNSGVPLQKSGKVSITRHGSEKPDIPVVRGMGASPLTRVG